jgi:hypothetical protein
MCWEILTVNLHGVIGVVVQIIFACFVWPYVSYSVVDGSLDVQERMFHKFDLCLTVHLQCRQCNKIKTN